MAPAAGAPAQAVSPASAFCRTGGFTPVVIAIRGQVPSVGATIQLNGSPANQENNSYGGHQNNSVEFAYARALGVATDARRSRPLRSFGADYLRIDHQDSAVPPIENGRFLPCAGALTPCMQLPSKEVRALDLVEQCGRNFNLPAAGPGEDSAAMRQKL